MLLRTRLIEGREDKDTIRAQHTPNFAKNGEAIRMIHHADAVHCKHDDVERPVGILRHRSRVGEIESNERKPGPALIDHFGHAIHADVVTTQLPKRPDRASTANTNIEDPPVADEFGNRAQGRAFRGGEFIAMRVISDGSTRGIADDRVYDADG